MTGGCFAEPVIGLRAAQTRWLAMTIDGSGVHPRYAAHAAAADRFTDME
jgi:hypothetical protein